MKLRTLFSISFLTLSFFIVFSACKNKSSHEAESKAGNTILTTDSLQLSTENHYITDFRLFTHTLDSTQNISASLAINEFKRLFSGKSAGLCDSAYCILQQYVDTVELKLNEKFQEDTTDYSALFNNTAIPEKVLKTQKALGMVGFKFGTSEGSVYITQDKSSLIKNLLPMFSVPMQAYLLQIEKENQEGFTRDAHIVISPRTHVERIIWYENFVAKNPDFVLISTCKNYKKAYLTYLFTGIDNTNLYENENEMKLALYFVQVYNYLLKTYPESETAALVLPYKQAIEQKQKSVVDELLKKYVIKGLIYSRGF